MTCELSSKFLAQCFVCVCVCMCVCACAKVFIEGSVVKGMPVCASGFDVWLNKYVAIHYVLEAEHRS